MNVLVTGGRGFIGSHLVRELKKQNHNVKSFDLTDGQDITSAKEVDEAVEGNDFVFHLAGMLGTHELVGNTKMAVDVNIGGTVNVLDACRKHGVKLIEISKPNVWLNTYSITKEASEMFTEMYRHEFKLKAAVVKWFNVYGPGQKLFEEVGYRKAVPTWIVNGLKGDPLEVYGSGHQTMDLVHTDDTVSSVIAIMNNFDKCEGHTFEVGKDEYEANEVAAMIKGLTGNKSEIINIPMRPGETLHTKLKANTELLEEITNWKAEVPLEEGLKQCVAWYANNYKIKQ